MQLEEIDVVNLSLEEKVVDAQQSLWSSADGKKYEWAASSKNQSQRGMAMPIA